MLTLSASRRDILGGSSFVKTVVESASIAESLEILEEKEGQVGQEAQVAH